MKELISVIVPCYNVESFVEKCILSIANQAYENLEIIAIDDCSKDRTYTILTNLKEKINNLTVYKNEKNIGLAATRNFGVKKSNGNYLGFIDSDDYIGELYYEKLMDKINNNTDVVVCDIILKDIEGNNLSGTISACVGEVNKENVVNNGLAASACNKLIKKEHLIKYPFLEGKINEDVASIIPIIVNCKNIEYVECVQYNYVQRNSSIQNSAFSEKRFDMFYSVETCLERIRESKNYEDLKSIIIFNQLILLYFYVITAQENFNIRYKLIKKFMEKQKELKLNENKYSNKFIKEQKRYEKIYFYIIKMLLNMRLASLTNLTIILKNQFKKYKDKIKGKYWAVISKLLIKKNIEFNHLEKEAKRQKRLKDEKIKISVIVPNYNYEKFLYKRIYSILAQTTKIHEVIILDDCSEDNSRVMIDEIVEKLNPYINIKKIYNEQNSGGAFKQWEKGFEMAVGDYVWIAEADDCCNKNLLKNIVKPIYKNKDIYISYADTAFINADDIIFLKSIKSEIDIRNTKHWDKNYINKGIDEIFNYSFLNCTIANVSSCIIKNGKYNDAFSKAIQYRQSGDWIFYVNIIKNGYISYINKPLNYYRVHGNNITSTMKKHKHLEEIKQIHNEINAIIDINEWHISEREKRYKFLEQAWKLDRGI